MPGQRSRMGAVSNGRAAAVPKPGNTMPDFEHGHRCTMFLSGVGGGSRVLDVHWEVEECRARPFRSAKS